jgi:hypothetical protein
MRGTLARTQIVTLFLSKLLGAKRCFLDTIFKHLLALYLLSDSTPVELFSSSLDGSNTHLAWLILNGLLSFVRQMLL